MLDEVVRLRAENASLRAEVERMRRRYEIPPQPVTPPTPDTTPEPERFAIVAPALKPGAPLDAWDGLGNTLSRILERHHPT